MNDTPAYRCAQALVVAMLGPAFVVAITSFEFKVAIAIAAVSSAHAIILGVPVYLLLRWARWANAFTSIIAGTLIGAVPIGSVLFPAAQRFSGASAILGSVPTMINGIPTEAGWNEYFHTLWLFAIFGAASGLLFWLFLWWRMRGDV